MKKHQIIILLFALLFISILLTRNKQYFRINGYTQGTTYQVVYQHKKTNNLNAEIPKLLKEIDLSLSTYLDSSLITRINQNDTNVRLDNHLREVLSKALEVSRATNGLFDITVGPLVNLYGFGPAETNTAIDSFIIDSLRKLVGYQKIRIKNNRVFKSNPNVYLDLNAIAQGYSVDFIADFFEKKNIENYLIEIGGEVKAKGKNPEGKYWKIGVDK